MPQARENQISLDATSTYHCISRCVRRQFLCGKDAHTGKDFSHRRDWIRARIFELQSIFAIEVCAYAVMSNHAHLVLCVQQDFALDWDDREIARRWLKLFGGKPLVRSFVAGEKLSEAQKSAVSALLERYRERLFSISWFMRCLNEPIARQANAEDNVSGRFWEGRFKSQALLDEAAVVAAMAYVDLNPIRAAMADTPEESDYTSIQQRVLEQDPKIAARDPERIEALPEDLRTAIGRLMPFSDQAPDDPEHAIPYQIQDYLELVDWSGRAIIEGKRGRIPDDLPPILERLKIDPHNYLRFINRTQKSRFHGFIGSMKSMQGLAADFGRSFLKGQAAAAALFSPG
ncbi:MAG: transposase [Spiribacter salinus]|uniref:Transposase n=1 Tax=Spiribacter salinus TaxID=1335746 RepID=A0A540VU68_9GAMM|nr:MAG: transposase [Spiribacter salinus]